MKQLFIFIIYFIIGIQGFAQENQTHKVEKGDTVYKLAQEYHTTEEVIYELNPGAEKSIQLGQILILPPEIIGQESGKKPLRFESYVVKQKETVFGISQQNGINMNELQKYNPYLYEEELGMGDTLQIPVFTKGKPKPINYNQSIQNSDFGNLLHVVLPKETAYGIAKEYGIKLSRLRDLNPGMGTLRPGEVLVVSQEKRPVEPSQVIMNDSLFTFYEVKHFDKGSPETIYSLTRKFGISRDSLFALNPILKEEGLNAGMKLKVPVLEHPISKSTFGAEIINLETLISNYDPKELVVLLPFQLNSLKTDSLSQQKELLKQNRLARISLDFYSGVLLALEKAKSLGISANVRTFDTEQSEHKIDSILQENNFSETQAVIGPLLGNMIEFTAEKLSQKNIPVFSPLTKMEMKAYDNLFQTRPTDEQLQNAMMNYLDSTFANEHIVIVSDKQNSNVKSKLQEKFPLAVSVDISGEYSEAGTLSPKLLKVQPNWVILEAENVALIGSVLAHLNLLVSQGYNIQLFTTNRNNSYESDEISNLNLSHLKFTFPSFTKEPNMDENSEFVTAYKNEHGIKPNKFVVRGYDLTYDILLRLAAAKSFENALEYNWTTEYNENKFHYVEKHNGGYINTAIYILQIDKDLTIKTLTP